MPEMPVEDTQLALPLLRKIALLSFSGESTGGLEQRLLRIRNHHTPSSK